MRSPVYAHALLTMLLTVSLAACAGGKQESAKSAASADGKASGTRVKEGLSLHGFALEQGKVANAAEYGAASRFNIQVLDGDDPVVGAKVSIVRLEPGSQKGKYKNADMAAADGETTNLFTLLVVAGTEYMVSAEAPGHGKMTKRITFDASAPVDVDFPLQLNGGDTVVGQNGQKPSSQQQQWQQQGGGPDDIMQPGAEQSVKGLKYCDIAVSDPASDMKQMIAILAAEIPEATPAIKQQMDGGGKPIACSSADWPGMSMVFKMPKGTVRVLIDDATRLADKYYDDGTGNSPIAQQKPSQQKPSQQSPSQQKPAQQGQMTAGQLPGDDGANTAPAPQKAASSDDDDSQCNSSGGSAALGNKLGTVSEETNDIDFSGKSVYAVSTAAGAFRTLSFVITNVEARDSQFKKIKSWECKRKSNCDQSTTPQSVSVTLLPSFTGDANHKIDANGFPKGDANHKEGQTDFLAGLNISYSGNPALADNKGDFNFTAGKRPAKVGDEFEVTADFKFQDGKSYKAKLKGKVFELPTPPTPPTCADNEQPNPIYE